MSDSKTMAALAEQMAEAARAGQRNFTHGYEALVRGLMHATVQQLELSRGLMEGAMADLNLLAQARTPDALVAAEIEVLRRRAERTIGAVRTVTQEMGSIWAEAIGNVAMTLPGVGNAPTGGGAADHPRSDKPNGGTKS